MCHTHTLKFKTYLYLDTYLIRNRENQSSLASCKELGWDLAAVRWLLAENLMLRNAIARTPLQPKEMRPLTRAKQFVVAVCGGSTCANIQVSAPGERQVSFG